MTGEPFSRGKRAAGDDYPYAAPPDLPPQIPQFDAPHLTASELTSLLDSADSPRYHLPSERQFVAGTCLLALALLFNFLACWLFGSFQNNPRLLQFCVAVIFGVSLAQGAAVSIGLVFGRNPLWLRLVVHWAAALLLFGASEIGLLFAELTPSKGVWWSAFTGMPMVALAGQLPLWVMRFYFQWQIVFPTDEPCPAPRPLSIGDIMLGTAVVALSMASMRAGRDTAGAAAQEAWLEDAAVLGICVVLSAASVLPLLYWTLRVRKFAWGIVAVLTYAIALSALWLALAMNIAPLRALPWFVVPGVIVSYTATLSAALWTARACGGRLLVGRG